MIDDEILNEEIDKIKKIGYEAVSEKEIYLAEMSSKLFVYKYLDWAKTILLEKTEIDEGEVTKKINTMLKELQK